MRTVREVVATGINSIPDLQEALSMAIQLEFSTIPPYLCAQWSINGDDPSGLGGTLGEIAIQEMQHFGLACNMLNAIGGTVAIANTAFVPTYPTLGLPGHVQPGLMVDLLPLGLQALNTFMQIEFPEQGVIAPDPASIGAFYTAIANAFTALQPPISTTAPQVSEGGIAPVRSVADAIGAINLIKEQGEGTATSPNESMTALAHYFAFGQMYFGKKLIPVQGGFQYAGDPVTLPAVFPFPVDHVTPPDQSAFIRVFSRLLTDLEACWTQGASMADAFDAMQGLRTAGTALIEAGAKPQFVFQAN